jgi:hypothetical protein
VLDRELAVEFFFLFFGQGVHKDDAVGERCLRLSTMRTDVAGAADSVFAKIEFIDLKRPAAIEIDATFEFHKEEQRFVMNLIDHAEKGLKSFFPNHKIFTRNGDAFMQRL